MRFNFTSQALTGVTKTFRVFRKAALPGQHLYAITARSQNVADRSILLASSSSMEDAAVPGVASEIYAKHRNSTQPESQQVCAVLGAVLEVVQAEGLQPTPTTLFAALMASMEKPETQASAQVSMQLPSAKHLEWQFLYTVLSSHAGLVYLKKLCVRLWEQCVLS